MYSQRAYSIKTRIKTLAGFTNFVVVAPAQRAYSIKTRIKTLTIFIERQHVRASESIFH